MLRLRPHPRRTRALALPAAGVRVWVLLLACWLAVLQLAVPSLGLMHQVVHHVSAPALAAGSTTALAASDGEQAASPAGEAQAHDALLHLFDGHSAADCQLFDQMALGLAVLVTPWHWDAPPPVHHAFWTTQALLLRKSPALFFARGPPVSLLG